jgi:hypothetical protein
MTYRKGVEGLVCFALAFAEEGIAQLEHTRQSEVAFHQDNGSVDVPLDWRWQDPVAHQRHCIERTTRMAGLQQQVAEEYV